MNKRHQVWGGGGSWGHGFFVIISTASLESEVPPQYVFFPFLFKTSHQEALWFWHIQRCVRGSTVVWHWRSHRKGSQIVKRKKKPKQQKNQTHNPKEFGM